MLKVHKGDWEMWCDLYMDARYFLLHSGMGNSVVNKITGLRDGLHGSMFILGKNGVGAFSLAFLAVSFPIL